MSRVSIPEDPGFDPLTGQGEGQSFCPSESTFVQTCLCLTPPSCVRQRTQICAHAKDPISIGRKRVGITAGGRVTQKYCLHYAINELRLGG